MLQLGSNDDLAYIALQFVNCLCETSSKIQETLCLAGIIEHLKRYGGQQSSRQLQIEVALFIGRLI